MDPLYAEVMKRRLPAIADKLAGLRTELYASVARAVIDAFCSGLYAGTHAPKNTPLFVKLSINVQSPVTVNESEKITAGEIFDESFTFGYEMTTYAHHKNLPPEGQLIDLAETAEFLSERLGCTDYCSQAIARFLGQPDKARTES